MRYFLSSIFSRQFCKEFGTSHSIMREGGSANEIGGGGGAIKLSSRGQEGIGLGRLQSLHLKPEHQLQTPNYFVHTLSGSVPHLTPDVFGMTLDPAGDQGLPPLQISIETTFTFHENVHPSGLTISQFVGLPKCSSFLTVHNPLNKSISGYNDKSGISIWPRTGRASLSSRKFLEIISHFQPDIFQCLSDFDVKALSSTKRVKKSAKRTLEFLQEILEKTPETGPKIIATIEIGWFLVDKDEGRRTVVAMLEKRDRFAGFLINGIKNFDDVNEVTGINMEVLVELLTLLPTESLKFVSGAFEPHEILDLVCKGVDIFDSSFVTRLTGNGQAFGFSLNEFEFVPKGANEDLQYIQDTTARALKEDKPDKSEIIFSLKDKRFYDDFRPISSECACHACRKHTRAYIHHLLMTGELLGFVLLMSHNLFHFDRYFKAIRLCLEDVEKFDALKLRLRPPAQQVKEVVEIAG